jgi:type 1 glutamine amidotransferase
MTTRRRTLTLVLCAMLASALGGTVQAAPRPSGPRVVFLVAEDEYKSAETLPPFAARELEPRGVRATFVLADAGNPNGFSGLRAIDQMDLLFVSMRRRAPAKEEMTVIRAHLAAGRPLVGLRTASHAFGFRGAVPDGHEAWPQFDLEVLGGRYTGHYGNKDGTDVHLAPRAASHPVLAGVSGFPWRARGTLYRFPEVRADATVLLRGKAQDRGQEVDQPVAWTYSHGRSRVFYTSLGHPGDFELPAFRRLLVNGILWALGDKARVARAQPRR